MRRLLALLPLALVLPFAPGLADPVPCSSPCAVGAHSAGYVPPVAVLANNSSVVWQGLDIGHIQRETTSPLDPSPCFTVSSPSGGNSTPVHFHVEGGALHATVNGTTRSCDSAVGTGAAGFALAYHCTLHAEMRGTLLVLA